MEFKTKYKSISNPSLAFSPVSEAKRFPTLRRARVFPPLRGVRGVFFTLFFLLTASFLLPTEIQAQTWNEWFKQKKTQRKYLVKQIALLKVYLGYLKEGYEIANKGLTTIHNIKNGDLNLHRNFFGSLKNVNPHIRNSAKVADIIAFQAAVIRSIKQTYTFCKSNPHFTPEEVRYIAAIYSNMLFLCDASVSELLLIIRSSTGYQMTDNERLVRIDTLYDDMLDKHAFVQSLDNDVRILASEREREQRAIEWTHKQYETTN